MTATGARPVAAHDTTGALTAITTGGPTVLLRIQGLAVLVDPTFDPAGEYPTGRGYSLVKTAGPALTAADLGPVDAVLLSHDQHVDNLDTAGREAVAAARTVLTTPAAASRLGPPATPLEPWATADLTAPDGRNVVVTALPAQHGPDGTEHLTGPVSGFLLTGQGSPRVYVSGDNASLDVVRDIRGAVGPVDVAVIFAGAATTPLIDGTLTVTAEQAAEAALILEARVVLPVHYDGWEHFREGAARLRDAFARGGILDRLVLRPHGAAVDLWPPDPRSAPPPAAA